MQPASEARDPASPGTSAVPSPGQFGDIVVAQHGEPGAAEPMAEESSAATSTMPRPSSSGCGPRNRIQAAMEFSAATANADASLASLTTAVVLKKAGSKLRKKKVGKNKRSTLARLAAPNPRRDRRASVGGTAGSSASLKTPEQPLPSSSGKAETQANSGGGSKLSALVNAKVLPTVSGAKGGAAKPDLVSVVKQAKAKYTGADTCKDMHGRRHEIAALRVKRNKAVLKGMKYMTKFLKKDNYKALFEIGDDAPSIFFEIWYTSANSQIRMRGKELARVFLTTLMEERLEKVKGSYGDRDDFFEYIFLLRCMKEMDMDCDRLLAAADLSWKKNGFADTDELFEVTKEGLADISTADWLMLLMRILMMEYMHVVCWPNRWRMKWGLKEAMLALKAHPLKCATDGEGFHDAFYLATHIGYMISAYSAVQAPIQRMVPWLDSYIRHSFRSIKRTWEKNEKQGLNEYVDVDGIGEIVDTFRGMGLTEASDPYCCEGTLYLLKVQNKDGSFPTTFANGQEAKAAYDKLHSTWVCTQCLRDRDFQITRNIKWLSHAEKLLRLTDFGKLEYTKTWK